MFHDTRVEGEEDDNDGESDAPNCPILYYCLKSLETSTRYLKNSDVTSTMHLYKLENTIIQTRLKQIQTNIDDFLKRKVLICPLLREYN